MIDFNTRMYKIDEFRETKKDEEEDTITRPASGEKASLIDICLNRSYQLPNGQAVERCFSFNSMLIDFVYELSTDSYPIEKYATNEDLLKKIKQGRSDPPYIIMPAGNFLAETTPADIKQDFETGLIEDISTAEATTWSVFIKNSRNEDIDESFYEVWEEKLQEMVDEFNANSKHVKIYLFSVYGLRLAFREDILADLNMIQVAIILVAVYTVVVLGTFSTIHCRLVVSLMGLVCVGISYASGFGLMYLMGGQTAGVHNLMPFLLIGIGVDDMFVICNAVD